MLGVHARALRSSACHGEIAVRFVNCGSTAAAMEGESRDFVAGQRTRAAFENRSPDLEKSTRPNTAWTTNRQSCEYGLENPS